MRYGLQLFSVRDAAADDYEQMLKQVAEMGYSTVETAGFFDHSASEIKELVAKYGLTIVGAHTCFNQLLPDVEGSIKFYTEMGCHDIICPWADIYTRENLDKFVNEVNFLVPKFKEAGITLHYHNHSGEFLPNKDGQKPFYELVARTELMFEVDTFWVFNAGLDPVSFIEEYKDRIKLVHLKDGIEADLSNYKYPDNPHAEVKRLALGEGNAPVAAVRKKAIELGFEMVVESEGLDPSGIEEVKRCIDYLHSLDAE